MGLCDPRTLSFPWGLIWCWTSRKPYVSICCWPCRWSRSAAPTAGGCAPGVGRISMSRIVGASPWRRLIRGSRRCGSSRTRGVNSRILSVSRRSCNGYSKATTIQDERRHAARPLEVGPHHVGGLPELPRADASSSRLPDLRPVRGAGSHQNREAGHQVTRGEPVSAAVPGGDAALTIAVDAMGGDHAPEAVVAGAVAAARDFGVTVLLVGPLASVEQELARHRPVPSTIRIVDAPEVVEMHEAPVMAVRRKKRSSIVVAMG